MDTMDMDDYNEEVGSSGIDEDEDMDVENGSGGSESDNEPDDDDADNIVSSTAKSKKKRKRKTLELDAKGKPKLSSKQIKELQEAEVLGQSNLYRFQIEEFLDEIMVKTKVRVKIHEWLEGFKTFVNKIKPSKSYPLNTYKKLLDDVQLPFPANINPKRADKSTFQWTRPESIHEVGSWSYNTPVGKLSPFDIAVEMPAALFHKTDLLNHIYHLKRAIYVAYLAKKLRNCGDEVKFASFNGDPLKPILQVYIKNKKLLHVQIHFILPATFDKFQKSRLAPVRNNVRADYFLGVQLEGEETGPMTPSYNNGILQDLLFLSNKEITANLVAKSQSVCDAIKLLKVWLTQRGLNQGFGSFSGFIMTMFVAYLSHKKKIHDKMSSYQIIRIVFLNLMQSDWCTSGVTFESTEKEVLAEWHSSHDVVFLDPSGQLNLTGNMSRFTFHRIKSEAKVALEHLNSSSTSAFQSMFITKVPFFLGFDNILQLDVTEELHQRFMTDEKWSGHYLNFSGYEIPLAARIIGPLIERCLGQRVRMIDFQLPESSDWETSELRKPDTTVRFGLIINRDFAFKLIEKCESEDAIHSASFKEFWGDKSQLRRFMDGTMMESVSFDGGDEQRIPFQMLKFILERHLDVELRSESEEYLDGQLDRLLDPELVMTKFVEPTRPPPSGNEPKKKRAKYAPKVKKGPPETEPVQMDQVTSLASKSFDGLSKALRQLEGLPLDITSVQGTSAVLRFSNIYPTPPQRFATSAFLTEAMGSILKINEPAEEGSIPKVTKHVEPIGVVVQLEASGKWPDDIKAIERLKCAFLIRIGQLLQEQFSLTVQFFPRYLLVLRDGFIFRIRLTYFRELILLKQLRGEDGILRSRDNHESLTLERESLILPQLTSTLNSLNREFGAFGRTCRLAKRWIASHLLLGTLFDHHSSIRHPDPRFTEESIELLVASLFLQHAPFLSAPNEAQLGFLRFLNLLGNTDWKSTSFILNFNSKLSKREIEKIEVDFVKRRDALPLLFIATPEDKLGSVWTRHLSQTILLRGGVLAKFALDTLLADLSRNDLLEGGEGKDETLKWRKLFTPSTKVFDAIIWIKKGMIPTRSQGMGSANFKLRFTEYKKGGGEEVMPIVEFDPVKLYFQELRETFGHLCNFVTDVYGGNFIAFAWKPEALKSRKFEISQVRGKKLGKDGKSLVVDVDGILEEMEFMGEGIVDHIEVKKGSSQAV